MCELVNDRGQDLARTGNFVCPELRMNNYSRRTKDRPAEKCLILIWRVTQSIYCQYKQYSVRSLKRLLRRRSNVMHIPFDTEKAFVIV